METGRIEISEPRRFGLGAVLAIYILSFLLVIPILIALLVVSLMHLGIFTFAIPLLTLAGTIYVLPFIGNAYVSRVVRRLVPSATKADTGFIVQITLSPRIRTGLRALVEDADDVGFLTFTASELSFRGDSVNLAIPFQQIRAIHADNVGLRGLYVAAGRIRVELSGLQDFDSVDIAERSSGVLPTSRKLSRELLAQLRARAKH
jgi:hypothetical protein